MAWISNIQLRQRRIVLAKTLGKMLTWRRIITTEVTSWVLASSKKQACKWRSYSGPSWTMIKMQLCQMSLVCNARMIIFVEKSFNHIVQCAHVMFSGWFVNVDRRVSSMQLWGGWSQICMHDAVKMQGGQMCQVCYARCDANTNTITRIKKPGTFHIWIYRTLFVHKHKPAHGHGHCHADRGPDFFLPPRSHRRYC